MLNCIFYVYFYWLNDTTLHALLCIVDYTTTSSQLNEVENSANVRRPSIKRVHFKEVC